MRQQFNLCKKKRLQHENEFSPEAEISWIHSNTRHVVSITLAAIQSFWNEKTLGITFSLIWFNTITSVWIRIFIRVLHKTAKGSVNVNIAVWVIKKWLWRLRWPVNNFRITNPILGIFVQKLSPVLITWSCSKANVLVLKCVCD